jgi:Uma2 family endonuclease
MSVGYGAPPVFGQVMRIVTGAPNPPYDIAGARRGQAFHARSAVGTMGANETPMNVRPNLQMDKPAFLAWVEGREGRYELAEGRVLMMTGGSRAHSQITGNLHFALKSRLDGHRWTILLDFGVDVGPKTVRYPDIVVDPAPARPRDLIAAAPVFIAEVLSPSTERIDLGDKAAEYLHLQSLAAYLVFAQDEQRAWIWLRDATGFPPGPQVLTEPNDIIRISVLAIDFPLAEVYDLMTFG